MEEKSSVKLYGTQSRLSPYVMRIELALKLKGIEYEFIGEDLANKSEFLLKYNPVYKKVPILVHKGQPICESLVILEYIDETWMQPPSLFPQDPYLKAKVRFWASYFQLIAVKTREVFMNQGEDKENAIKESLEKMDIAEEGLKELYPNDIPSFLVINPGYLDIVFYSLFWNYQIVEEFLGVSYMTPQRYPLLTSWIKALKEVPQVKEVTPSASSLLNYFQSIQHVKLAQKS